MSILRIASLTLALVPLALAQPAPDEIGRLVRQLGDDDFDKREAANAKLDALGVTALVALDRAAGHADVEVRRRGAALIDTIEGRVWGKPLAIGGKQLPEWEKALDSKIPGERRAALKAAPSFPQPERILPAILGRATDDDDDVRLQAIQVLAQFGTSAPPAVEVFRAARSDPNASIRVAAARGIWVATNRAELALPTLTAMLDDRDAVATLGGMGYLAREAIPALTKALAGARPEAGLGLACALARIEPGNEAARAFLIRFAANETNAESGLRAQAIAHLGLSLPLRHEVVAALLRATADTDPLVRIAAVRQLPDLDEPSPEALKTLLRLLEESDVETRAEVALVLGQLAPTRPEFVRGLAKLLAEDLKPLLRTFRLIGFLGKAGPAKGEALPVLLASLEKSPNSTVLVQALAQLAEPKSVPILIEALKRPATRRSAIEALARLGPDAAVAVPLLIEALDDANGWRVPASALARIGEPSLDPLLQALGHKNTQVALHAGEALGQLGPRAVGPLAKVLAEGNVQQRGFAAVGLMKIGPEAKAAIPALLAVLKEKGPRPTFCVHALCKIDPAHRDVYPVLVEQINGHVTGRYPAIQAMGELGPLARDALPALNLALVNPPPEFKWVLVESIAKIDPKAEKPLQLIREGLRAEVSADRVRAWHVVGDLGRFDPKLVASLPDAIAGKDRAVRSAASAALVKLCRRIETFDPAAVDLIGRALREDRRNPYLEPLLPRVASALGELGPRARPMAGVLAEALHGAPPQQRPEVALALWRIDRSPLAVPTLVRCLTSRSVPEVLGVLAAPAVGSIGEAARPATPALVLATTASEPLAAYLALLKVDPTARDWVLPVLIRSLREPNTVAERVETVSALADYGPAARAALPKLRRLAESTFEPIRQAIASALRKIEP